MVLKLHYNGRTHLDFLAIFAKNQSAHSPVLGGTDRLSEQVLWKTKARHSNYEAFDSFEASKKVSDTERTKKFCQWREDFESIRKQFFISVFCTRVL